MKSLCIDTFFLRALYLLAAKALIGFGFLYAADPNPLFRIDIVDSKTGRPVPLVELRTTSELNWVSDNAGTIAIDAPELFDREVWFDVVGHGYEVKKDGFGYRGVRLTPKHSATHRLEIDRVCLAERWGRLSGSGLFAESQKFGENLDKPESGVVGCDTVRSTLYDGKRFWLWGDTKVQHYPLGIFNTLGAVTDAVPFDLTNSVLDPRFQYFRKEDGRVRGIAAIPHKGPVWLGGLVSLRDQTGTEHLVASYAKIRGFLSAAELGLCEWNSKMQSFEMLVSVWNKDNPLADKPEDVLIPDGHVSRYVDNEKKRWILFCDPLPYMKIPDDYESWRNLRSWKVIPPVKSLQDSDSQTVQLHKGCTVWSEYRKRWICVFTEKQGKPSSLGEIWYAESLKPEGPWSRAVKILTHENYTFYNPCIHADWQPNDSPYIFFEGTYTAEFANRPPRTARYDYNQILYRLDLSEPTISGIAVESIPEVQ